jgi:hypothetical protein
VDEMEVHPKKTLKESSIFEGEARLLPAFWIPISYPTIYFDCAAEV